VNPEQTGLRIEQREAGVVMVDEALESVDDATEKLGSSRLVIRRLLISSRTWTRSRWRASCD